MTDSYIGRPFVSRPTRPTNGAGAREICRIGLPGCTVRPVVGTAPRVGDRCPGLPPLRGEGRMTIHPAGSPEALRVVRKWLAQGEPRGPAESRIYAVAYRAAYDQITPRPRNDQAKRRAQAIAHHAGKQALENYRHR